MSIRRALRDIAVGAFSEAIEPVEMVLVNRRLRGASSSDADVAALSDDDVLAFLAADGARAKELDEKLQKLTAVLSVAVTVGGLVSQTLLGGVTASWLKTVIAITFLLAELYLVVGVVVGFDGLRPRPRYGYGPGFLRLMAEGGKAKQDELVRAANGSLRDNMIRANQVSAAATAIRNGVLLFAFAVVLGLWAAGRSPSPVSTGAAAVSENRLGLRYRKEDELAGLAFRLENGRSRSVLTLSFQIGHVGFVPGHAIPPARLDAEP